MGSASSKPPQETITTRTEQTSEGYKTITERRTRTSGLFGGETVETVTTIAGGNPRLAAVTGGVGQPRVTSGDDLHEFAKEWSVRVALVQVLLRKALEDKRGTNLGTLDILSRKMNFGPVAVPSMLLAVAEMSGTAIKLTWAWAHPAWNEKFDSPLRRLQLVGQNLNNKDLTADVLLVEPESYEGQGDRVLNDVVGAAVRVLGLNSWFYLYHEGAGYVFLLKLDEATPPLPAEATRKADLRDLHQNFKALLEVLPLDDFNEGVAGMASADGMTYETTADGWSVTEPGENGRQLVYKVTGNRNGELEYEHTLYSIAPTTIDGQDSTMRIAYTIKSHNDPEPLGSETAEELSLNSAEELGLSSGGPPGPESDCKQLFAYAADTALYSRLRTFEWVKQAIAHVVIESFDDLVIESAGVGHQRFKGRERSVDVPFDVVAIINKDARSIEWTWHRGLADQIRIAGSEVGNTDLTTAKLSVAPGIDMEHAASAVLFTACKATSIHVGHSIDLPSGERMIILLRVEDVPEVPRHPLILPSLFHSWEWMLNIMPVYDLQRAAQGLALKMDWTYSEQDDLWKLHDPHRVETFTCQPDPERETGTDFKISIDILAQLETEGGVTTVNVHNDNLRKQITMEPAP